MARGSPDEHPRPPSASRHPRATDHSSPARHHRTTAHPAAGPDAAPLPASAGSVPVRRPATPSQPTITRHWTTSRVGRGRSRSGWPRVLRDLLVHRRTPSNYSLRVIVDCVPAARNTRVEAWPRPQAVPSAQPKRAPTADALLIDCHSPVIYRGVLPDGGRTCARQAVPAG